MLPQQVVEQNLKAWNEVAPRHAEHNLASTKELLSTTTAHYVDSVLREHLEELGLDGSVIGQFNCNNGRELISAVQLGAKKGYGFDFSPEFLGQARSLAAVSGVDVEFVETNIYETPAAYDATIDIMILTSGALCWMPDLRAYFDVVGRVLKPGGSLLIYETHPFLEMFKLDRERDSSEPFVPHYPYFMKEPVRSTKGLDYYSVEIYGKEVVYWYHHTLSGIFQSVIDSGFTIRHFQEFEHDIDSGYAEVLKFKARPPMSYLVSATR